MPCQDGTRSLAPGLENLGAQNFRGNMAPLWVALEGAALRGVPHAVLLLTPALTLFSISVTSKDIGLPEALNSKNSVKHLVLSSPSETQRESHLPSMEFASPSLIPFLPEWLRVLLRDKLFHVNTPQIGNHK